jgi:hypothetical protein
MIQRYRVIILSPAFAELDEIFKFVKQRSPERHRNHRQTL